MIRPLCLTYLCVKSAAFGLPVVPLVNCKLHTSCGLTASVLRSKSADEIELPRAIESSYVRNGFERRPGSGLTRTISRRSGRPPPALAASISNLSALLIVPMFEAVNKSLQSTQFSCNYKCENR